jgi:hypothetical protein
MKKVNAYFINSNIVVYFTKTFQCESYKKN